MKHLLTVEQLSGREITEIFKLAREFKKGRGKAKQKQPLKGQTWALDLQQVQHTHPCQF